MRASFSMPDSNSFRSISRAAQRNKTRLQTGTFEDNALEKDVTPTDVMAARRASIARRASLQPGSQPMPYGHRYQRRKLLFCSKEQCSRKKKKAYDHEAGPVKIEATVESIGAYLAQQKQKERWNQVIDPRNSRLMSLWDLLMLFTLGLVAIITPFEVAFIPPSSDYDGLFWLNRCFDVVFIIDSEPAGAQTLTDLACTFLDDDRRSSPACDSFLKLCHNVYAEGGHRHQRWSRVGQIEAQDRCALHEGLVCDRHALYDPLIGRLHREESECRYRWDRKYDMGDLQGGPRAEVGQTHPIGPS